MSMSATPANSEKPAEVLLKPHPERFLLLGGAWLAMTLTGVMGGIALVNPQKKIPIIDPLIRSFSQEQTVVEGVLPQQIDKAWDATHSFDLATIFLVEKVEIEKAIEAEKIVAPVEVAPLADPALGIPGWVYLAIASSCIAGSSLITFCLYKTTLSLRRKRHSARLNARNKRVMGRQSSGVANNFVPVKPRPVQAIAPLQISTPTNVELPHVQLEPVVDPQSPSRPKLSRAEQLAMLAKQAKQREAKSLIDSVDIRRRNRWASFS